MKLDFLDTNIRIDKGFTVAVKLQISETITFRGLAPLF